MAIVEISSGNQQSFSANRNWFTNSPPYGYGGRIADRIVFPVRIIMSPTCSSRFFTGRNTRSDAALTTTELLPRENYPRSPETRTPREAYGMPFGSARGNRRCASAGLGPVRSLVFSWRGRTLNRRAEADIGGMFG